MSFVSKALPIASSQPSQQVISQPLLKSEHEKKPFIPTDTPEDVLFAQCFKLGIVDEDGRVISESVKKIELPPLEGELQRPLICLLSASFDAFVKYNRFALNLSIVDLFEGLMTLPKGQVPDVKLVGGAVSWALGSSYYFKACEKLKVFPPNTFFEKVNRQPSDVDFRVNCSLAKENLYALDENYLKFLSTRAFGNSNYIESVRYYVKAPPHGHPTIKNSEVFITSLTSLEGDKFDFTFWKSLERHCLFSLDNLHIPLSPLIKWLRGPLREYRRQKSKLSFIKWLDDTGWIKKHPLPSLKLESWEETTWQAVLDRLLALVHVPQVESMGYKGWSMHMGYITKGYSSPKEGVEKTLFNAMLGGSTDPKGVSPYLLTGLLKETWMKHLNGDPFACLILTFNACIALEVKGKEVDGLWKEMHPEFESIHFPRFPNIKILQIPFELVSAMVQVMAFCHYGMFDSQVVAVRKHNGAPALQINMGYTILIPICLEKACRVIENYISVGEPSFALFDQMYRFFFSYSKSRNPKIFQSHARHMDLDWDALRKLSVEAIKSSQTVLRRLGFALLMTSYRADVSRKGLDLVCHQLPQCITSWHDPILLKTYLEENIFNRKGFLDRFQRLFIKKQFKELQVASAWIQVLVETGKRASVKMANKLWKEYSFLLDDRDAVCKVLFVAHLKFLHVNQAIQVLDVLMLSEELSQEEKVSFLKMFVNVLKKGSQKVTSRVHMTVHKLVRRKKLQETSACHHEILWLVGSWIQEEPFLGVSLLSHASRNGWLEKEGIKVLLDFAEQSCSKDVFELLFNIIHSNDVEEDLSFRLFALQWKQIGFHSELNLPEAIVRCVQLLSQCSKGFELALWDIPQKIISKVLDNHSKDSFLLLHSLTILSHPQFRLSLKGRENELISMSVRCAKAALETQKDELRVPIQKCVKGILELSNSVSNDLAELLVGMLGENWKSQFHVSLKIKEYLSLRLNPITLLLKGDLLISWIVAIDVHKINGSFSPSAMEHIVKQMWRTLRQPSFHLQKVKEMFSIVFSERRLPEKPISRNAFSGSFSVIYVTLNELHPECSVLYFQRVCTLKVKAAIAKKIYSEAWLRIFEKLKDNHLHFAAELLSQHVQDFVKMLGVAKMKGILDPFILRLVKDRDLIYIRILENYVCSDQCIWRDILRGSMALSVDRKMTLWRLWLQQVGFDSLIKLDSRERYDYWDDILNYQKSINYVSFSSVLQHLSQVKSFFNVTGLQVDADGICCKIFCGSCRVVREKVKAANLILDFRNSIQMYISKKLSWKLDVFIIDLLVSDGNLDHFLKGISFLDRLMKNHQHQVQTRLLIKIVKLSGKYSAKNKLLLTQDVQVCCKRLCAHQLEPRDLVSVLDGIHDFDSSEMLEEGISLVTSQNIYEYTEENRSEVAKPIFHVLHKVVKKGDIDYQRRIELLKDKKLINCLTTHQLKTLWGDLLQSILKEASNKVAVYSFSAIKSFLENRKNLTHNDCKICLAILPNLFARVASSMETADCFQPLLFSLIQSVNVTLSINFKFSKKFALKDVVPLCTGYDDLIKFVSGLLNSLLKADYDCVQLENLYLHRVGLILNEIIKRDFYEIIDPLSLLKDFIFSRKPGPTKQYEEHTSLCFNMLIFAAVEKKQLLCRTQKVVELAFYLNSRLPAPPQFTRKHRRMVFYQVIKQLTKQSSPAYLWRACKIVKKMQFDLFGEVPTGFQDLYQILFERCKKNPLLLCEGTSFVARVNSTFFSSKILICANGSKEGRRISANLCCQMFNILYEILKNNPGAMVNANGKKTILEYTSLFIGMAAAKNGFEKQYRRYYDCVRQLMPKVIEHVCSEKEFEKWALGVCGLLWFIQDGKKNDRFSPNLTAKEKEYGFELFQQWVRMIIKSPFSNAREIIKGLLEKARVIEYNGAFLDNLDKLEQLINRKK